MTTAVPRSSNNTPVLDSGESEALRQIEENKSLWRYH